MAPWVAALWAPLAPTPATGPQPGRRATGAPTAARVPDLGATPGTSVALFICCSAEAYRKANSTREGHDRSVTGPSPLPPGATGQGPKAGLAAEVAASAAGAVPALPAGGSRARRSPHKKRARPSPGRAGRCWGRLAFPGLWPWPRRRRGLRRGELRRGERRGARGPRGLAPGHRRCPVGAGRGTCPWRWEGAELTAALGRAGSPVRAWMQPKLRPSGGDKSSPSGRLRFARFPRMARPCRVGAGGCGPAVPQFLHVGRCCKKRGG